MFAFTAQHLVIEVPESTSDCPEPNTIQKISHKNTSQYLLQGEEIRDWPGLNNLALSWWIGARLFDAGRDLWVETAQSHLPCFALCKKITPNKQRAAKPYKMAMNWVQVTQKKQQQTQVYVSKIYCLRRDFAQKAKSRGGTLVTRAYIKESTYSWNIQSYSQYRKTLDLLEQRPRRPRGMQSVGRVKRHDESFQAWTEEPLGTDSHRTISQRSRECWFLIGTKNALYYCA